MSDQTPPPYQPAPVPAEGLGVGIGAGPAAPPPPTSGATAIGAYPPPPAPAKKSHAKLIVAIVAALIVLGLIAGLAVVLVVARNGPVKHSISIPATAGGMKRDTAKESELKTQLVAVEQQFKAQAKNFSYVKSGVYHQDDTLRGPQGALVFLGARLSKAQSPTAFVTSFGKQASANGFKIDKISAGDGGGKAVCASQASAQKVAICAWATRDSMGELVPTVPGYDSKQLAKILLALRADVEKTL